MALSVSLQRVSQVHKTVKVKAKILAGLEHCQLYIKN